MSGSSASEDFSDSESESFGDEDFGVVNMGEGAILPYQDEPLADEAAGEETEQAMETDIDGISVQAIQLRSEGSTPVQVW